MPLSYKGFFMINVKMQAITAMKLQDMLNMPGGMVC